jgi:hypothetical protein
VSLDFSILPVAIRHQMHYSTGLKNSRMTGNPERHKALIHSHLAFFCAG